MKSERGTQSERERERENHSIEWEEVQGTKGHTKRKVSKLFIGSYKALEQKERCFMQNLTARLRVTLLIPHFTFGPANRKHPHHRLVSELKRRTEENIEERETDVSQLGPLEVNFSISSMRVVRKEKRAQEMRMQIKHQK